MTSIRGAENDIERLRREVAELCHECGEIRGAGNEIERLQREVAELRHDMERGMANHVADINDR